MTDLLRGTGTATRRAGLRSGRQLAWQRTDTVGTELVFSSPASAEGTAVVAGASAYTSQWRAELDADGAVRSLRMTCRGAGGSRALWLDRADDGWSCRTEETGDLHGSAGGPAGLPPPGIDDPMRLEPGAVVRLADSPVSLSWTLRRLGLTPADGPVTVPTVRVLLPSLAVLPGVSTFRMLGDRRLRVTGDEPACTYDMDGGVVTYQPGRFRLVH
ncbi:putative glycolipid-binding domain-containing protein [Actinoplanes sp. NPDC049316]|uniref:putative glycolipid-binding domain-containing protein n=1 Tax=Actinoplanes sp. NPDC049316 TaxID=3154727 RepID=UPI0034168DD7